MLYSAGHSRLLLTRSFKKPHIVDWLLLGIKDKSTALRESSHESRKSVANVQRIINSQQSGKILSSRGYHQRKTIRNEEKLTIKQTFTYYIHLCQVLCWRLDRKWVQHRTEQQRPWFTGEHCSYKSHRTTVEETSTWAVVGWREKRKKQPRDINCFLQPLPFQSAPCLSQSAILIPYVGRAGCFTRRHLSQGKQAEWLIMPTQFFLERKGTDLKTVCPWEA